MTKRLLFSVTIKDCIVQTFRSGGKGGQNVNKVESGVRIIHPPSGARGQSTDTRDQYRNKRLAWVRMAESKEFQIWHKKVCAILLGQEEQIESEMEKVKTYNLADNRVTDHRTGEKSANVEEYLDGNKL